MYAKSLHIYGFRSFGKAELKLQYPGRTGRESPEFRNVNLVLGDNGGGKSSVLRALAIAVLAPALLDSGFVPYRLVRRSGPDRPAADKAFLKVEVVPDKDEPFPASSRRKKQELIARIEMRGRGNLDRLHLDGTPDSPITDLLYDDYSPAFFVAGYGATRRVETGDFSQSSALKTRGLRYQRVASLFEDHVALRPLGTWLPRLKDRDEGRWASAIELMGEVLPPNVRFEGALDEEDQFLFDFDGVPTPFSSLSDGYKAFVGMVGDLIGHIADVAPAGVDVRKVSGIVLVDEIDLHLHPEWQRTVVPLLASAFPRLQFVFTTHSPLVASTVRRENVFVTATADDGTATVRQLEERVHGRSAEQLLLSSYFGLRTTRPEGFQDEAQELFDRAAAGNSRAALEYLERLTAPATAALPPTPKRARRR